MSLKQVTDIKYQQIEDITLGRGISSSVGTSSAARICISIHACSHFVLARRHVKQIMLC